MDWSLPKGILNENRFQTQKIGIVINFYGTVRIIEEEMFTNSQINNNCLISLQSCSASELKLMIQVKLSTVSSGRTPGPVPANSTVSVSASKSTETALLINTTLQRAALSREIENKDKS